MSNIDPSWIAPRTGHDWRDEDILRAAEWLKSFVSSRDWERRIETTRANFLKAKAEWLKGSPSPLFNPADVIAWHIFQAETYAIDRQFWVPEATARIAPILLRIGQELDALRSVAGVGERVARLMNSERRQPAGGLFELIVALAYRRHGWSDVAFVPERPGLAQTHDLNVSRPRRRWGVECKRMDGRGYSDDEKARAEVLARPVHDLSLAAYRSIIVEADFHQELDMIGEHHLAERAEAFLSDPTHDSWSDEASSGRIRDIDWRLIHSVMRHDFVYFGGSRMIELLSGEYDHQADHSMAAKWRPAAERPFYADAVYQASVVSWKSSSPDAIFRKARHFRSMIGRACAQLPTDMPGVIHVGIESANGNSVDFARHLLNLVEMRTFDAGGSRLRWVYGNYFAPENTTRSDESWALNETTVPYKIGRHSVANPLPHHFLLTPETESRSGTHWDGLD